MRRFEAEYLGMGVSGPIAAFERAPLARAAASPPRGAARTFVRERAGADVADGLDAEWDALAARASAPNAFAERWFVAASLAAFPEMRAGLRLLEVRSDGRLIGLLPVSIEPRYGRVPVRHVENAAHHHSFLGTPLVEAGAEARFWRAILDHLDAAPWAPAFLHIDGLVESEPLHQALADAAEAMGRPAPVVHRERRALLDSPLGPQAYYETHVRKKKRKEIARLSNRLGELGAIACRTLEDPADLPAWTDDFLGLEASGWKGARGSALGADPATAAFFRGALAGAQAAGRLQLLRLEVGGRPIAMLVNFLCPPGSFSFKTAYDEAFARFSPGVLIQLRNLDILARGDVAWMDSCAAEDHPMIDSLWAERRTLVRVTIPLAGLRRRALYLCARALEEGSALRRRLLARMRS